MERFLFLFNKNIFLVIENLDKKLVTPCKFDE